MILLLGTHFSSVGYVRWICPVEKRVSDPALTVVARTEKTSTFGSSNSRFVDQSRELSTYTGVEVQ